MVSIWARVGLCVHDNRLTKEDISALVKFLRADELPQRTHAARALGTIAAVGNPGALINPAIPALIKMLDDKEELGQIAAIWSLGQIGAPAEPALKRLNEMLQDKTVSDEGKAFVREAIEMIQRRAKR
jgi:HEAT repeat protein